jgi:hypothetical protein
MTRPNGGGGPADVVGEVPGGIDVASAARVRRVGAHRVRVSRILHHHRHDDPWLELGVRVRADALEADRITSR